MNMAKGYTPQWKDPEGNILVLFDKGVLYPTREEALEGQHRLYIEYSLHGLETFGIFELEYDKDTYRAEIFHTKAFLVGLGHFLIIGGPKLIRRHIN